MADDVTGAVRRTPRPYPSTEDRQTPEIAAPACPGATNTATPVSPDAGTGSDDLRRVFRCVRCGADRWVGWRAGPEHEGYPRKAQCVPCGRVQDLPPLADPPGLAELRAKLNNVRVTLPFPTLNDDVDRIVAEYAELPDCTACGGSGKDDHATVFEAPLAVHFAGPPVKAEGRRRQLCMWCGHVLRDVPSTPDAPPPWPDGALVRVEDGLGEVVPYEPGAELPPGCCALPDDEFADDLCGKHVEGTSSNRCLLTAGHTGDCSDEFEPPLLENDAERQADEEHAPAADWPAEPEDTHADEVDRD